MIRKIYFMSLKLENYTKIVVKLLIINQFYTKPSHEREKKDFPTNCNIQITQDCNKL